MNPNNQPSSLERNQSIFPITISQVKHVSFPFRDQRRLPNYEVIPQNFLQSKSESPYDNRKYNAQLFTNHQQFTPKSSDIKKIKAQFLRSQLKQDSLSDKEISPSFYPNQISLRSQNQISPTRFVNDSSEDGKLTTRKEKQSSFLCLTSILSKQQSLSKKNNIEEISYQKNGISSIKNELLETKKNHKNQKVEVLQEEQISDSVKQKFDNNVQKNNEDLEQSNLMAIRSNHFSRINDKFKQNQKMQNSLLQKVKLVVSNKRSKLDEFATKPTQESKEIDNIIYEYEIEKSKSRERLIKRIQALPVNQERQYIWNKHGLDDSKWNLPILKNKK